MGKGEGSGKGCCSSDAPPTFQTYAGDNDTVDGGKLSHRGWPDRIRIDKMSRAKGVIVDLPMCLVFLVFWILMFVFANVGFEKGDPRRLIYGTDYAGHLCGDGTEPLNWSTMADSCIVGGVNRCPHQSLNWSENRFLWYPLPYSGALEKGSLDLETAGLPVTGFSATDFENDADNFDFDTALNTGICVKECPQFAYEPGVDITALFSGQNPLFLNLNRVYTYGGKKILADGTVDSPPISPFFFVWYNSNDTLRRCAPVGAAIGAIERVQSKLPSTAFVDDFWNRALNDVENSWRVFIICAFTILILCILYTFLLRACLKPCIVLGIILALAILLLLGYLCWQKYTNLKDDDDPSNDDESKAWQIAAFVLWAGALTFLLVMICLRKQIMTACEIIIQSGKVIRADMTLLLVPIITAISVCILLVWCIYVGLYIYTIEEEGSQYQFNQSYSANGVTVSSPVNMTVINENVTVRNMLYYVFFGFLWTMGTLNAIGFFVVAASTTQWYYSHRDDDEKGLTMVINWLRGYGWAFLHIGGLVTGAFLVAIVQMARFIVEQFSKQLETHFGEDAGKCIRCLIQCCLAYLERVLQYITKMSYVIMAVQGSGFWCACCDLMTILLDNVGLFSAIAVISDIVFFVGKLLLTLGNAAIAYTLLESEDLAPGVSNGILIVILVGLASYAIACLFMHVYATVIDSMVILVARELRMGESADTIACPGNVFEIVTGKKKDQQGLADYRQANEAKIAERQEAKDKKMGKVQPSAPQGEA